MDGGLRHYTGDRDQDHPRGKEMQKSKMAPYHTSDVFHAYLFSVFLLILFK